MKRNLIEIIILLLVSCFVVFFQFNQVPKKLSWDEVEFTRLALSLADKPYTPYSQLATGHSTLYFYTILLSFKIFGVTNFALRFPSALFGILNILLFYLITKTVLPKINYFEKHFLNPSLIPFFLSLILISSRWYFNFARFSFEATFLLFLELVSIYFLFKFTPLSFWQATKERVQNRSFEQRFRIHPEDSSRGTSRNDIVYLILSAIFSGLAFHSYYPGRIFFLLPLIFIIFYSSRKFLKRNVLIFIAIFLIVVSPLLIYLSTHKDLRIQEQLFLTDKKLNLGQKVNYFGSNVGAIAGMFTHFGDLNGRHNYPGKPQFNPVVGAFFLFGLLVTVLNLKNVFNQFFLTFFILSLLPALFTYPVENPNSLRTYTSLVSAMYFVGNGLVFLFQSEQKSKMLFFITVIFISILFILSSLYDLRTYFRYQKVVFSKSFELNGSIKKILNLRLWEKIQSI